MTSKQENLIDIMTKPTCDASAIVLLFSIVTTSIVAVFYGLAFRSMDYATRRWSRSPFTRSPAVAGFARVRAESLALHLAC